MLSYEPLQSELCQSKVEAGYRRIPSNGNLVITEQNRGLATSILGGFHTVYTEILVLNRTIWRICHLHYNQLRLYPILFYKRSATPYHQTSVRLPNKTPRDMTAHIPSPLSIMRWCGTTHRYQYQFRVSLTSHSRQSLHNSKEIRIRSNKVYYFSGGFGCWYLTFICLSKKQIVL